MPTLIFSIRDSEQLMSICKAERALSEAGVTFGISVNTNFQSGDGQTRVWHLDSLKGATIGKEE